MLSPLFSISYKGVNEMLVYLTSHMGGSYIENGKRLPTSLNAQNGFTDHLKAHWKAQANVLIISADPNAAEMNDGMRALFETAFSMSGLPVCRLVICDRRNQDILESLADFDVIILSGGHVPTQNAFFQQIRLREKLKGFDGILIGISAGTMNCAETVYAQPELEGESTDPQYQRFLPGLGITGLMILPHYQEIKHHILDGKRVMEDITYPDSRGRAFYALTDGSYITIENGQTTLFGEGYLIQDGRVRQICAENQTLQI